MKTAALIIATAKAISCPTGYYDANGSCVDYDECNPTTTTTTTTTTARTTTTSGSAPPLFPGLCEVGPKLSYEAGLEYCRSYGGELFNPRTAADKAFLSTIDEDVWIGPRAQNGFYQYSDDLSWANLLFIGCKAPKNNGYNYKKSCIKYKKGKECDEDHDCEHKHYVLCSHPNRDCSNSGGDGVSEDFCKILPKTTHAQATANCEAMGGHLFNPQEGGDWAFAIDHLFTEDIWIAPKINNGRYEFDGKPMSGVFNEMCKTYSNNLNGGTKSCIKLKKADDCDTEHDCTHDHYYVCQKNGQPCRSAGLTGRRRRSTDPCPSDHTCVNLPGSYECVPPFSCFDGNNAGCSHICNSKEKKCECPECSILDKDGKTCVADPSMLEVSCSFNGITAKVSQCLLGPNAAAIGVVGTNCWTPVTSPSTEITVPLGHCGTELIQTATEIKFSTTIKITQRKTALQLANIDLDVSCSFDPFISVSTSTNTTRRVVEFSAPPGHGEFEFIASYYLDEARTQPITTETIIKQTNLFFSVRPRNRF